MVSEEGVGHGSDSEGPVDHFLSLEDSLRPYQVRDEERIEARLQHNCVVVLALTNVGPVAFNLRLVEVRLEVNNVVLQELDAVARRLFVFGRFGNVLQDLISLRFPRCLPSFDAF